MSLSATKPGTIVPSFHTGLEVRFLKDTLSFSYGPGVFGPKPEYRSLDSIRPSLRDPNCSGPDPVYGIAMDMGRVEDREELEKRMLLFGIVIYAKGKLGDGPVRSQGHVHRVAPHCGWSTPELFEIWHGHGIVYGQQKSGDDPGRCVAIEVVRGDRVVIPPGWAHYVANASVDETTDICRLVRPPIRVLSTHKCAPTTALPGSLSFLKRERLAGNRIQPTPRPSWCARKPAIIRNWISRRTFRSTSNFASHQHPCSGSQIRHASAFSGHIFSPEFVAAHGRNVWQQFSKRSS